MNPCPLNISTQTLSAYSAHLLPDDERIPLATHIADCAACRHHMAAYEAIRRTLRQQRSPVDTQAVWRQLNAHIVTQRGGFMLQKSSIAWLSGLALCALLLIAFLIIFTLRPSPDTQPAISVSPTATAILTPTSPTATLTPSATVTPTPQSGPPGGIQVALFYPADQAPPLTVYAIDTTNPHHFYDLSVPHFPASGAVTIAPIQPGTYFVVGYPDVAQFYGKATIYAGAWTPCQATSTNCTDHTLLPVVVQSGKTTTGIQLADWYAPASAYPPRPTP